MEPMTLLIMAAGMGSRYGGLKQLDRILGKTILEYSIQDAKKAGFNHCVCVIRPEMQDDFEKYILGNVELGITIVYQTLEAPRKKPWGTGQAVLAAKKAIKGPFMVINADDYYGEGAFKLVSSFFKQQSVGSCLVGYFLKNTLSMHGPVSRGVCTVDSDNYLHAIEEKTAIRSLDNGQIVCAEGDLLSLETIVSMNCWGLRPSFLDFLEMEFESFLREYGDDWSAEFYLPAVINQWILRNKESVSVLYTDEMWSGITYKEDKKNLEAFLIRKNLVG